jgi:glycosyltransferase involved in cell wall biosynthesis
VFLVQESIVSYRIPIFNLIGEKVNLTIGYTKKNDASLKDNFNVKKLNKITIGGLHFIKNGFFKLCRNYDVVIIMPDLHYISYSMLPFLKSNYKVIPWTIGIRASYTRRYDVNREKDLIDKVYLKILQESDAIIFYMKQPKFFWKEELDHKKIFIAHNTVEVLDIDLKFQLKDKKSILFLGTLYKEKKIYELIEAFIRAKKSFVNSNFFTLDIIGTGKELENIKKLISDNDLEHSAILHGAIYDEKVLAGFFNKAIMCVSPDQAGLSVLKSMGYGVPFVTRSTAITGGEKFNITNNVNGFFYDDEEELKQIIVDAANSPDIFIEMGKRAREHYMSKATIKNMADNVINAINFTLK